MLRDSIPIPIPWKMEKGSRGGSEGMREGVKGEGMREGVKA
jgi:hypothetical protein